MRKFLIGTMLVSLLAALAIGGVLAWTGSYTEQQNAATGSASAEIWNVVNTGNLVVPTGDPIKVANGGIYNNSDIPVGVTSGSVSDATVSGVGTCGLTGSVNVTNANNVAVGATASPLYDVYLTMATFASDACQNGAITYNLTINVES